VSRLAGHVQNLNDATVDHLRRALYPGLKCMTGVSPQRLRDKVLSAYDEVGVPRPFIWVRDWTDDKRDEWIRAGKAGARAFFERTAPRYNVWRDLTRVVEGVNEFIAWTPDDMRWANEFTTEAAILYQQHGNQFVGGDWSVGHPDLALWQYYGDALRHMDFLGLHEYDWPEGKTSDGTPFLWDPWRVFRYKKVRQTILSQNMRLPPILITEVGWARGVWSTSQGDVGFKTAPDPNALYPWFISYDAKVTADTDVRFAAIFQTGANSDWQTFDIVGSYTGNVIADYTRVNALHPVVSEPETINAELTDAEKAKLRELYAKAVPATLKNAIARNRLFVGEVPPNLYLSWDPAYGRYEMNKLDPSTWELLDSQPL